VGKLEQVQYHIRCKKGEVNKAVLLPGNTERADYIGAKFFQDSEKIVENREFHIYNGSYEKKPMAVCSTGIGCMSAAVAIEELINIGCKYFIRVGTCGSFSPEINPGNIIIATGAVRGVGIIISHDAFYKGSVFADPDFLKREQVWIDSNVLSVENESSALFTIGYLRKVKIGTILTVVANHLTREVVTDEEKINPIFHQLTDLCLEAFKNIRKE